MDSLDRNAPFYWCRCCTSDCLVIITGIIMTCRNPQCMLILDISTQPTLKVNNRCWWANTNSLWWISQQKWGPVDFYHRARQKINLASSSVVYCLYGENLKVFLCYQRNRFYSSCWACCIVNNFSGTKTFLGLYDTCGKSSKETACICFWVVFFFFFLQTKNEIQLFSVSSLLWHITKLLRKAFMLPSRLFLSNMFPDILPFHSLARSQSHTRITHTTHNTSADSRDVSNSPACPINLTDQLLHTEHEGCDQF